MRGASRTRTWILGLAVAVPLVFSGTALAVSPHRPVISAPLSPNFGPVAGGTTVTFTGSNLRTPITVNFGANAATGCDFSGISGTSGTFTCPTPASSILGLVSVTVKNHANGNSGTLVLANAFTYTCDTCTASPVSAIFEGIPPSGGIVEPNGILEPGEGTQSFSPTWLNTSGVGFTGSAFTGDLSSPTLSGGTLTTPTSHAQYPNLAAGVSGQCSTCYTLNASFTATRPAVHVDATVLETPSFTGTADGSDAHTWKIHIGSSFPDVPTSQTFYTYIERLVHNQVTLGNLDGTYNPTGNTPRNQIAAFISRGDAGGDSFVPSSGTITAGDNPTVNGAYDCTSGPSLFNDVAAGDTFCKHIHYLAKLNVTNGCDTHTPKPNFCQTSLVTRRTMSVFLARAIVSPDGDALVPDANTGTGAFSGRSYDCTNGPAPFSDVALGSFGCAHIGFIWTLGIVDGNLGGTFTPDVNVSRDQMSKFITNAFDLGIGNP